MTDYISRADAIADLEELAERYNGTVTADGVDLAIDRINALPSADAVQGEWLEVEVLSEVYDIEGVKTWGSKMQCDQCGFRHTAIEGRMVQYNFCPNCGADMRGEKNGDK